MTINVRYHGGLKQQLPKAARKTHKVHARSIKDIVSYTEQLLPFREWLKTASVDIAIGPNLTEARILSLAQIGRATIPSGATVHIIPRAQGGIPGAVLVSALVSIGVSIAVTLLADLLFPTATGKSDTRKNHLYQNGLQTNKEGVPLPVAYGKRVQCGGNVIEADYDYSASGGSSPYAGYDSTLSEQAAFYGVAKNGGYSSAIQTDSNAVLNSITSFKGKGGGKTISNTTYSDAIIKFAMAHSAGEIGGIVGSNGIEKSKNIWVNKVPLVDPTSGTPNFHGISWEERVGVAGQDKLRLTTGTSNPKTSGVDLTQSQVVPVLAQDAYGNTIVVRQGQGQLYLVNQVSGANINRVKLDFRINQLVQSDKKGNQNRASVTFAADTKRASDAAWTPAGSWTINEKSSQAFDRTYTISAPAGADDDNDPWYFRVYRTTPDSTSDLLQNSTTFAGWVEIIDKAYSYDGTEATGNAPTALFAAAIDMASFNISDKPEIAIVVEGKKVRVPDVFDPNARTYSGVWNGAWKYASTDNPVWNWLDVATDRTNGCGFPDSFFDPYDLLACAKRSDEQIHGRFRYTLNKQFTDQSDGWHQLQDIAQTFRAWPYYNGKNIVLVQDRPGTPDHFINNSHVQDGKFLYATTDAQQQYNEVIVQWDNPDDYYRVASERYQDTTNIALLQRKGISNNGIVSKTVYKVGCTNRQEAYDYARALQWSALNENTTVTFTTTINANAYAPGQRILVDDWNITGKEWVGRINSVGNGQVQLDQAMIFKPNASYDALLIVNNRLVRRPINPFSNVTDTDTIILDVTGVQFDTPISIVENSADAAQPIEWRITDIQETGAGEYQVTGTRHIEGKFEFIDNNTPVAYVPWTQVQVITPTPQNMTFKPFTYIDDTLGGQLGIDVAWDRVISDLSGSVQGLALAGYVLEVQLPNGSSWTQAYKGTDNFTSLQSCYPGDYYFSLRSENALGRTSAANVQKFTLSNDGSTGILPPVFEGFN